jgi:two-component system, LuxR family, sensor kinase FixL
MRDAPISSGKRMPTPEVPRAVALGLASSASAALVMDPAGSVLEVNGAFCDLVDTSAADVRGRLWTDLVVAEERERARSEWEAHLEEGTGLSIALSFSRKDGSSFQAVARADAIPHSEGGIAAHVLHVSERPSSRDGDETLRQREPRIASILDSVAEGVVFLDENGWIRSTNRAAETMFGYGPGELVGLSLQDLFESSVEEAEGESEEIERAALGRKKSGWVFPVDLVMAAGEHGADAGAAIVRDASFRLMAERDVLQASEEARLAIAQDLHDELGQVLTGISLLAKALGTELPEPQSRKAERIAELTARAIDKVRNIARGLVPTDVHRRPFHDVLDEIARESSALLGVTCVFHGPTDIQEEDAFLKTQLCFIAKEAITNAVRHGGAQNIDLRFFVDDRRRTLLVINDGDGFSSTGGEEGAGLRGMRHRARLVGAVLELVGWGEGRTALRCSWWQK